VSDLIWIRQRHAFLNHPPMPVYSASYRAAPWPLTLFGERGIYGVSVTDDTINRAHELFPEAELVMRDPNSQGGVKILFQP